MDDFVSGNKSSDSRDVNHSDSSGRNWNDRYLVDKTLSNLSFVELQYVEVKSTNSYVKESARRLMRQPKSICRVRF